MFSPTRIIARPKDTGLGDHWGVQLFNQLVAHVTPEGVHVVPLAEFAKNRPVKEIKRIDPHQAGHVYARVEASRRNPWAYDLLERNCEHYATTVAGDVPDSPQVKGFLFVLLGVGLIWALHQ